MFQNGFLQTIQLAYLGTTTACTQMMEYDRTKIMEEETGRLLLSDDSDTIYSTNDSESDHLHRSSNLSILSFTLGFLGCLLCITSWIFVCCHRWKTIVSLGQPFFLGLVCFGSLLLTSKNLFEKAIGKVLHQSHPTTTTATTTSSYESRILDRICVARMWFFRLGLVIIYMSFFCKLWRAEQVCQFRRNQVIHVHHVIGPFFFICGLEIVVLIAQTIIAPPYWALVPIVPTRTTTNATTIDPIDDDWEEEVPTIETCYQFQLDNPTNMAFNAASTCIIVLSQAITLWMSYKTRKIREDVSDSRRIFQTMMVHLLLSVPMFLILNGWFFRFSTGHWNYFFEVTFPILLGISSVSFLILPKMHCVYYQHKHDGRLPTYASTIGGVHVSDATTATTATTTRRIEPKNNDALPSEKA